MNGRQLLLMATLSGLLAGAADAASFSRQVAVGPGDLVQVSNVAGSVTITTWDQKQVDVQGELGPGVDHVDVDQTNGRIAIKVVLQNRMGKFDWRDGAADLKIRLPADVRLEADTVSASLTVNGVRGRMRLKTVSGGLRADAPGDDVEASSVSGGVELTGSGAHARIRASSVSGSVELNRVGGSIESRSTSGSVRVSAEKADDVRVSTVSGGITVRGELARDADLDAQAVSGSVDIIATAPAGFRYDMTTFSGSISSCFGTDADRGARGRGNRIQGEHGDGAATVHVQSFSGSVRLCDH
jgi:DUF4097 and DUF4098 domain-containing protein YvlB